MNPQEIDKLLRELRELAALDDPTFSARTQSQRVCHQAAGAIEALLGKTRETDTLTERQREALEAAHIRWMDLSRFLPHLGNRADGCTCLREEGTSANAARARPGAAHTRRAGLGGGEQTMIARNLSVALMEAIQQHAEKHHGGKIDVNRTLSAIGDLASGFLAAIRERDDRGAHCVALVNGIISATSAKIAQAGDPLTRQ
jgi:hypothetical protein